jgi:hypothetical protein
VTVHQPVTASLNIGPTATIPTQFPSGAAISFTTGKPAAQVCSASRPMHVEYVSYTGALRALQLLLSVTAARCHYSIP